MEARSPTSTFAVDDAYRQALVETARAHGFPTLLDTERLGPMLERLSQVYNLSDGKEAAKLLPARLAFSFPRDVPKGHAAVRELVAAKALVPERDRAFRLLDVGAGLGAMTHGVVRALATAEPAHQVPAFAVEAVWVDTDRAAMELGLELTNRMFPAAESSGVNLQVRLEKGSAAGATRVKGPFDLIVCGQVMSEMDAEMEPEARVAHHAAWLTDLSKLLTPSGSLVVVEPALAVRTRHLHAVRDALLGSKLTVFAPCLHREPCPALAHPHDWCHEDLPTDLPEWLAPLARAAGLRWQGLTFSYLVLRTDGLTLRAASGRQLRVTSSLLKSKGKTEIFLCGEHADGIARGKARLLDREHAPGNAPFAEAERGDLLSLSPPLACAGRVGKDTRVECTRYR